MKDFYMNFGFTSFGIWVDRHDDIIVSIRAEGSDQNIEEEKCISKETLKQYIFELQELYNSIDKG